MLEEKDGLNFADFLTSVQEEEKNGECMECKNIKLTNTSFNGKLWATVNKHWYALYDGEKLETNAPVNREDLKSLLAKEFDSYTPHPFVKALQDLNSTCEHDEYIGFLATDNYVFEQVQEGDCAGWTLVYNRDKKIVAYMNWQACGCHVETIDEKFHNFLCKVTEKGSVYAELDDPELVDFESKFFWESVLKILKVKEGLLRKGGKKPVYYDVYSEESEE